MANIIKLSIYVFTIVITDPYRGIRYDDIAVYDFEREYRSISVTVHESDGYAEGESYREYEEENETYHSPELMYNTSEQAENYYFYKLFDKYNR